MRADAAPPTVHCGGASRSQHGYEMGPLAVFGVTAVGFVISLAVVQCLWGALAPQAEAVSRDRSSSAKPMPPYLSPVATPYSPSLSMRSEIPPLNIP